MEYSLLPRFLQIELTYACNSACTFCYNPDHHRQIDDDLRFRIIDEINGYGIKHVQLIGGEVTTLPNLPKYLDRLPDIKWKSLVTNGRIFVPELEGRVNEIYLSLHGNKETHETITKAKGSFEIIEESIKRYVAFGIAVQSDTVLTSRNYTEIFDIAERAKELGMSTLFVNIFQPAGIGSYFQDGLTPTVWQIRSAITQMIRAREELGINVQFGTSTPFCLDERLVPEGLAFTCGTGTWFASINPQGELRICNQSAKSYGNILDTPLNQIWHSREIDSEYRSLSWLAEPCQSCVFRLECIGGCRINDKGVARLDPVLQREPGALLSQAELQAIKMRYSPDRAWALA